MGGFPSGQREQTVNLPSQTSMVRIHPCPPFFAGMAELADALDSGSSESNFMQVQVLFPAPNENFCENGSFYLLQRNIKAKTGLEEAVVNQATVWPESGADRTASSRENQVPSTAPNQYNPNQIFRIGNGFGFFLIFLSQRYNTLTLQAGSGVLRDYGPLESLRT